MPRIAVILLFVFAATIAVAQTQPATQGLNEGPLKAVITAFEGKFVSVRSAPDQPWVAPAVGMELSEGAELRTGPKSLLQFKITDDQVITIDRLSTVQLIKANFSSGKVITDLGMKYGRTQYNIEAAGREHEAKVRSPSSVLAVRGTNFVSEDQPPFAARAISFDGRVAVRDARRQVSVGSRGGGKNVVRADKDSAAQTALADATPPLGADVARSTNEQSLNLSPQVHVNDAVSDANAVAFAKAQGLATLDGLTATGVLDNAGLASFELTYMGSPGADVDLVVVSPLGERVTIANDPNNPVPSTGTYVINAPADSTGQGGFDIVLWTNTAPPGVYNVTQTLVSGSFANGSLTIFNDKSLSDTDPRFQTDVSQTALTTANPSVSKQINLKPPARKRR